MSQKTGSVVMKLRRVATGRNAMNRKCTFEEYLDQNNLINPKYIPYYNNWVREFVQFCGGKMPGLNWESMSRFLARLDSTSNGVGVLLASAFHAPNTTGIAKPSGD